MTFCNSPNSILGPHDGQPPLTVACTNMISSEATFLALTFTALNDLAGQVDNVLNTFDTEAMTEKIWMVYQSKLALVASKPNGPDCLTVLSMMQIDWL